MNRCSTLEARPPPSARRHHPHPMNAYYFTSLPKRTRLDSCVSDSTWDGSLTHTRTYTLTHKHTDTTPKSLDRIAAVPAEGPDEGPLASCTWTVSVLRELSED